MNGTIFHIRSNESFKLSQGTLNSHIGVQIPESIIPNTDEHITLKCVSAEIPYSWYNTSDNLNNNIITYDTVEKIELGNKNYSASELMKFLNGLSEQPFQFQYNTFTGKVTITNKDITPHTINFGIGFVYRILGAKPQNEVILPGLSIELNSLLDLCSVHAIYICTNLSSGNVVSTSSSNSSILQKIQINNNSSSIIYLDMTSYISTANLQTAIVSAFEIELKDQNHNLLDLNLVDWELTLVFDKIKRPENNIIIEPGSIEPLPLPPEPAEEEPPTPTTEDDLNDLIDRLRDESGLNEEEGGG